MADRREAELPKDYHLLVAPMRPAALIPQPDPVMFDQNSPSGGGDDLIPVIILIAMLAVGYGAYAYIFEDPNAGLGIDRSQLYVVEYAGGEESDGFTGPTQIWQSGSSEEGSGASED